MKLAERLADLGTETAFAVSAEAAAMAETGKKVYPFHLGDINIRTPENIIAAAEQAMRSGKTGYCSNYGIPALREAVAEDINKSHGTSYGPENVLIQPGGKPVINKFLLSVMNPGDKVLYPNPGYPIYESLIGYYGGDGRAYGFTEGENTFRIRMDDIKEVPEPRVLVYNNNQNPTGAESPSEEIDHLAEVVRQKNLTVLCDEAYFDMRYSGRSESLVSRDGMVDHCVILQTFSKKFAMTGWRLGAALGPKPIIDAMAKLSVNDESCTNHFIQYAAIEALTGSQDGSRQILRTLEERRNMAVSLLNKMPGVRCFSPETTFYLFPNVTEVMERKGIGDYEEIRKSALTATGVSFCTRMHFGRPQPDEKQKYIRLAYSGIDTDQIEEGLALLNNFLLD